MLMAKYTARTPQLQLEHKDFLLQLMKISGPIMLQSLLTTSLSFFDTLMIGQLGDIAIASVGLANQMFFLIMLYFFGGQQWFGGIHSPVLG